MEKCTYCVQRIEEAKIAQMRKSNEYGEGSGDIALADRRFKVGLPAGVPGRGDHLRQPQRSERAGLHRQGRMSATTACSPTSARARARPISGRVRNPNTDMPGAEHIGHTSEFEEESPGAGKERRRQTGRDELNPNPRNARSDPRPAGTLQNERANFNLVVFKSPSCLSLSKDETRFAVRQVRQLSKTVESNAFHPDASGPSTSYRIDDGDQLAMPSFPPSAGRRSSEPPEFAQARAELVREPYVANGRDAAWVGDHIASVVQNPAPLWWWIASVIAAGVAAFTGLGIALSHHHGRRRLGREQLGQLGVGHHQLRLLDRHRPRRNDDRRHSLSHAPALGHRHQPRGGGDDHLRGHVRRASIPPSTSAASGSPGISRRSRTATPSGPTSAARCSGTSSPSPPTSRSRSCSGTSASSPTPPRCATG